MKIKRVEFLTSVITPSRQNQRVQAVVPGEDTGIEIGGGMLTISRDGFDSTMVPLTNVKCIVVEGTTGRQGGAKKGK